MTRAAPFFSVVITTMDRTHLLKDAIASVLGQSFQDFEIILVDDGGIPENIHQILNGLRCIYVNKRHYRPGVSASRNIGLGLASGRYVVFLDDDDRLSPLFLAQVKILAESQPGKAFFGNYFVVEEQVSVTERRELSRKQEIICNNDTADMFIRNFIPICAIAIPVTARLPKFDESLPSHEDWDFLLSCLKDIEFIGMNHFVCEVRQRQYQSNQHRNNSRAQFHGLDYLAVYQRHPNADIASQRSVALQAHGLQVPPSLLQNIGRSIIFK